MRRSFATLATAVVLAGGQLAAQIHPSGGTWTLGANAHVVAMPHLDYVVYYGKTLEGIINSSDLTTSNIRVKGNWGTGGGVQVSYMNAEGVTTGFRWGAALTLQYNYLFVRKIYQRADVYQSFPNGFPLLETYYYGVFVDSEVAQYSVFLPMELGWSFSLSEGENGTPDLIAAVKYAPAFMTIYEVYGVTKGLFNPLGFGLDVEWSRKEGEKGNLLNPSFHRVSFGALAQTARSSWYLSLGYHVPL